MIEQQNGHVETNRQFRASEHLIQLKGKDYLPVQWRLVWFRQECPQGSIETEIIHLDLEKETEEEVVAWNPATRRSEKSIKTAKGIAVVRATVRDGKGGVATGTKMEKAASFGDWLEKAETGAIGRALAGLGYGTQFAPELNEEHRIVDAPVDPAQSDASNEKPAPSKPAPVKKPEPQMPATKSMANGVTDSQQNTIANLCKRLGKQPPSFHGMTEEKAGDLIKTLAAEFNEKKGQVA